MKLKLNKYIGAAIALLYASAMGGPINSSSLLPQALSETFSLCSVAEAGNISPGMGIKKKTQSNYYGNIVPSYNKNKGGYSFEINTEYKKKQPNAKKTMAKPVQRKVQEPEHHNVAKPVQKPVQQPRPTLTRPASQTAKQPVARPAQRRVQEPVHHNVTKPASQTAVKPVQQPKKTWTRTSSQTASKPVQRPAQNTVNKPAQRPVQNTANKPVQRPVQNTVRKPAQSPAQNTVNKPAQRPAQNMAKKPLQYKPIDRKPISPAARGYQKKPIGAVAPAKPSARSANGIGNIPMLSGHYSGLKNRTDEIKVGLDGGLKNATVSSIVDYDIYADATGLPIGAFKSGTLVTFGAAAGITVNGTRVSSAALALVPRINGKSGNGRGHGLRFQGTEYRGEIVVELNGSGGLRIYNRVQLDDYLKGVVPSEMSPSWNGEALKAQAVAARTFALYNKKQGNHSDSGYDVCESTHCQSYGGYDGEDLASNAAVDATAGQVLMFGGQVIYAPFHASSGGLTENINDLWGSKLPYLKSVYDDDSESPYHDWSEDYTITELQNDLNAASKGVGRLLSIKFETNNGRPDGRMLSATFTGTAGSVTVDGGDMRNIFGLKSNYFTFKPQLSSPLGKTISKPTPNSRSAKPARSDSWDFINVVNPSQHIVLTGHGYGHGLGLSQYGAKAMGDKGTGYREILSHYYIGAELKQIY